MIVLSKNNGRNGFSVYRELRILTCQSTDEPVEVLLCRGIHLSLGECRSVQILHSQFARAQILLLALTLKLLHILHLACYLLVHIAESGSNHTVCIGLFANHCIQTNKRLHYSHCHRWRTLHSLPPCKRTVGQLQTRQQREIVGKAIAYLRLVEECGKHTLLLRFTVCFVEPRRFVEYNLLQFAVLLQCALQRSAVLCVTGFLLPECYVLLNSRVGEHDMAAQRIGIISRGKRHGVVAVGVRHCRQSLNHEPSGRIGVLNGQS